MRYVLLAQWLSFGFVFYSGWFDLKWGMRPDKVEIAVQCSPDFVIHFELSLGKGMTSSFLDLLPRNIEKKSWIVNATSLKVEKLRIQYNCILLKN